MYGASSHAKPKVCSGEQVIDVLDTAFGEAIITLLMIREQTDRVIICHPFVNKNTWVVSTFV